MEEVNAQHIAFIEQLVRLNGSMAELFKTSDLALFTEMNKAIKELYRIQHGSDDEVFRAIDPDCEIIYENFNMIIAVLRTTEDGVIDGGARKALDKFLHNIDDAVVNIASMLGVI